LSELGHLIGERFGRVHFGGTETASEFLGYIEGAVRSGYRCAQEMIERIKT